MPNMEWSFNLSKYKCKNLHDPFGYKAPTENIEIRVQTKQGLTQKEIDVLNSKSWTVAKSPFQSIFMTLFMFWMTGNSISIWTLMITISFLISPFKQIFSVNQAFIAFEGKIPLFLQKVCFASLHLFILGVAVYKFSAMGIIPDKAIDWMALIEQTKPRNLAYGLF
mmetsp:Transcript_21303/g.24495  ORF Transcript_21303/g.24495 Transcript_21303/m.24495 type:complete len:166 (-) Transcript_21303:36-533(-)